MNRGRPSYWTGFGIAALVNLFILAFVDMPSATGILVLVAATFLNGIMISGGAKSAYSAGFEDGQIAANSKHENSESAGL